ncbi:hypothetical protein HF563_16480 [Acidithiobacillus ferridurans]|nr:hypothetical protein [Acidithiobacillus ferridurans]
MESNRRTVQLHNEVSVGLAEEGEGRRQLRRIARRRLAIGTGLMALAVAGDAWALGGNVGTMANNASSVLQDILNLVLGGTFVGGLGFGGSSMLKAWEAHKQHGQGNAKWSHVATHAMVAAGLMGLPALTYHYEGTVFHNTTGAQVQQIQMGGPYG